MNNYFTEQELSCSCCNAFLLAPHFLDNLNALREACGHSLTVNSCCRCAEHNKKIGGKPSSFHLMDRKPGPSGTCAADISTVGWDSAKRWRFIKIVMYMEWSIGFNKTFIHIDRRASYGDSGWPNPVFFNY